MTNEPSTPEEELRNNLGDEGGLKSGQAVDELLESSIRDPLTGLYNRRYLTQKLEETPDDLPVAILMADIDLFKNINDLFGHPAGDRVIMKVAREMQNRVPIVAEDEQKDIVARYGGEEFVIVMPGLANIKVARKRAEEIRMAIEGLNGSHAENEIPCTLSIGVAVRDGNESLDETLANADKALYQAKQNGRNRVEIAQ